MNIADLTTRSKIQSRVSLLVQENIDADGNLEFSLISGIIIDEFGPDGLDIAEKQFNFMMY